MNFLINRHERSQTHFALIALWEIPPEPEKGEDAAKAAMAELISYHSGYDHWWNIADAISLAEDIGYLTGGFKRGKNLDHVIFNMAELITIVGCPTLARLSIQLCGGMAREDHFGAVIWTDSPSSESLPSASTTPDLSGVDLPEPVLSNRAE